MVAVYIRDRGRPEFFQNPNRTLTKKTTLESRLTYEMPFIMLFFVIIGQQDLQDTGGFRILENPKKLGLSIKFFTTGVNKKFKI